MYLWTYSDLLTTGNYFVHLAFRPGAICEFSLYTYSEMYLCMYLKIKF